MPALMADVCPAGRRRVMIGKVMERWIVTVID
jgi:hypothetical protein